MSLRPGARIGPYEVVELIGAGGMGEVYGSTDPRLGRDVAVKVLPESVANDPDRLARFEREARALARLSHPNILGIHELGRDGRTAFVVTEFLRGETLRRRLARERLPWRKALEIAAGVADGLASAHAQGIVHRDIKPENLFLTEDGQPRVLDFGIARLDPGRAPDDETRVGGTTPTSPGVVLGTAGYMAPEQARGEPGDARSDIFALGCVLFEMLSGRRAFARDTVRDVARAVQSDPLPDLADLALGIPPEVCRIVAHCTEKSPEDRFQSARDLAFDLRAALTAGTPVTFASRAAAVPVAGTDSVTTQRFRWPLWAGLGAAALILGIIAWVALRPRGSGSDAIDSAKTTTGTTQRIVVLPFENLGASEGAYFAAGMTEEITSRLAGLKGLAVTSRTTAVEYDRKGKTLKTLGAELGVDYVLEGTVRWDRAEGGTGRVRITPQLIRVRDDAHVWASSYDRELADVFALQSEVAGEVVRALGQSLSPAEASAVARARTQDLIAYDHYLKALQISRGSYDARERVESIGLLEQAVARDPQFVEAHALLAREHLQAFWFYQDRSRSRLEEARAAAEKTVSLGPEVSEARLALAYYYYQGHLDYGRALEEVHAAQQLQPGYPDAFALEAFVRRRAGEVENAARLLELAVGADPGNATYQNSLGETYWLLRRYHAADVPFGRSLTLNPRWGRVHSFRAAARLCETRDLGAAGSVLALAPEPSALLDGLEVSERRIQFMLLARRYDQAPVLLKGIRSEAFSMGLYNVPITRVTGDVLALKGDRAGAQRAYASALPLLDRELAQRPDDARVLTAEMSCD